MAQMAALGGRADGGRADGGKADGGKADGSSRRYMAQMAQTRGGGKALGGNGQALGGKAFGGNGKALGGKAFGEKALGGKAQDGRRLSAAQLRPVGTSGMRRAQQDMQRSVFCLAPREETCVTSRLYSSIAAVCIPVTICDTLHGAFPAAAAYASFSSGFS